MFPNSLPTQTLPAESENSSSILVVLSDFATAVTSILVLFGIATICRRIWPDRTYLPDFVAVFVFIAWIVLLSKLKIFPGRDTAGAKANSSVYSFVKTFLYFSVFFSLFDIWRHEFRGARSLVTNGISGLLVAGLMAVFGGDSKTFGASDNT
jgi:hypothetical protein